MADELRNKSLQDLEKEKVQAEIDILKARLEKEFPDEKPPGRFDKVADFAQKWSAFVLGTVTLISAVFGIFLPLSEYLAEQKRALEYELNENMIGFVNDLQVDSLASRGVVMLSYYEENSLRILLFYLESSNIGNFQNKIIETTNLIYLKRNSNVMEEVTYRLRNNFDLMRAEFISSGNKKINSTRQLAVRNYINLIKGLKLEPKDQEEN